MQANTVTPDQIQKFQRDGYLLVSTLFDGDEMELLRRVATKDQALNANTQRSADGKGRHIKLALWIEQGDDISGLFSRSRRIVDNIELLLGGEVYHFHSKMIQKEALTGGAWNWHQDYGYWYDRGLLFPQLVSCFIAVDRCTRENGCLKVMRGSHQIGRVDHVKIGDQTGADHERVEKALECLELVHCEMAIGDAIFFHCNLLHSSDQNNSPEPRWSLVCCYNRATNQGYKPSPHADYQPLKKVDDAAIKELGAKVADRGQDPGQTTAARLR